MRVLGLCSYPIESAATRFRMAQFVEPLSERGINLAICPFLSAEQFKQFYSGGGVLQQLTGMMPPILRRFGELAASRKYDLIFVQREAMMFGPSIFEWLFQKIGNIPLVLDLDDATYVKYISPSYGRAGSFFKFFGKTDNLIKRSSAVVCGNRFIAEYAESHNAKTIVVPTVVDTDKFCPLEKHNDVPVVGWIGTHSTFPFVESLFPVLERLAQKHRFVLKIVGSGRDKVEVRGVEVVNVAWNLDREIEDFQSLDIGLYPLFLSDSANQEWLLGKSGFKAIEYMAVGIPFVMSPAGVGAEIGEPGITHFNADTNDEWESTLEMLLASAPLRKEMGQNGRKFGVENYAVSVQAAKLENLFWEVTRK